MYRPAISQLVVYGAVAAAVLLLGARYLRATGEATAALPAPVRPLELSRGDGRGSVVHVAGAVRRPGVYRLAAGSRVGDAVRRAGGARRGANLEGVNLAAALSDGQQVVVPRRAATGGGGDGPAGSRAPLSLGSATLEQLDTLDGVGPATARKILEYRAAHGGFSSIDELDRVSGIGPKKLEALRAQVQP